MRAPRAGTFCNSKILFHKISVRLNNVFYDLGLFIILDPVSPFLVKASNLELYFGIFLQMNQTVSITPRTSF